MLNLEQQIVKQLEKSQQILIVLPADDDSDSQASALALFLFLKKMNKKVEIAQSKASSDNKKLSFLPAFSEIKNNLSNLRKFIVAIDIRQAKINQIKYTIDKNTLNFIISPTQGWFEQKDINLQSGEFKYDLIISIGLSDLESLGTLYDTNIEFFYKTTLINIDYRAGNEDFGQINLIDLSASSNSEILFYFLKNYQEKLIDEDLATCLLTGIIQQTKNFKTTNLSPRVLLTTSELISRGARREEIVNHLYRSRSLSSLKLWGEILNNLQTINNNELLWSRLSVQDFEENQNNSQALQAVIDELIANIPQTKIIIIFYEQGPEQVKVLVRALKNQNALKLLKDYSPKGTTKTAEVIVKQNLKQAQKQIISNLRKNLPNQSDNDIK